MFRELTGRPYSELLDKLRDGTLEFEYYLYSNNHDETAENIRALLPRLMQACVDFRIFELNSEDRPSSEEEWTRAEINQEFVYNLLESHEAGLDQIKRIDSLRFGDREEL
jgi:hypothetical protein